MYTRIMYWRSAGKLVWILLVSLHQICLDTQLQIDTSLENNIRPSDQGTHSSAFLYDRNRRQVLYPDTCFIHLVISIPPVHLYKRRAGPVDCSRLRQL
ncbi:hypothetical protein M752DRAFT_107755 [Aspergillus phoenicis ATCC 13157]|uniref:Secreted protein n=1 Tax=Aspergillus phoenicis ATCC 13157 TaxID=1353007 RepID=A0A370P5C6_ASPPH|nr:hypothetical protein M752DRAFT_107755 [Aspergillus phoenicis ATCC 13157]